MSLPKFSVKRPVTITMMFLGIVLLGFISYKSLNIELLPSIDIPKIVVETKVNNSPPEEIDNNVTQKIEKILSTLPNVKKVHSISTDEKSFVTVEFFWGEDMEYVMLKAREKLDKVSNELPEDAEKPNILYFDPSQAPILNIMVKSEGSFLALSNFVRENVKRRLERIEGVAQCELIGEDEEEIKILISNRSMVVNDISYSKLENVLKQNNITSSAGKIGDQNYEYSISLEKSKFTPKEIANLKVKDNIKIGDIGTVKREPAELEQFSKFNGERGLSLQIIKTSNANTVRVSEKIRKEIAKIEKAESGITFKTLYDDSDTIKNAVYNVILSIVIGGFLAFFVLFVFLHDFKSPFIIGLAMPLSIIATFIALYIADISINILSLGGLAIGIGLLVDNSIVVLENMDRFNQQGLMLKDASIKGASQVSMAILAGTLTTIAVFVPVLYLKGVIAVLFKQQAFVITVSLLASLLVALTLSPMMFSKKNRLVQKLNKLIKSKGEKAFDLIDNLIFKLKGLYENALNWALENKKKTILYTAAVFVLVFLLTPFLKREFVPKVQDNKFFMEYKLPTGYTIEGNEKYVKFVESVLKEKEDWIDYYVVNLGESYSQQISGLNTGYFLISLYKANKVEKLKNYLTESLESMNGKIKYYSSGSIYKDFFEFGEYDLEVILEGFEIDYLNKVADRLKPKLDNIKGFQLVIKDLELEREILELEFQEYFKKSINIPLYTVIEEIEKLTVGQKVTSVYEEGNEIDVRIKNERGVPSKEQFFEKIIEVEGQQYKLGDILKLNKVKVPNELKREDQKRKLSLLCNIKGVSLEKAISLVQKQFSDLDNTDNIEIKFGGKIENMKKSFSGLGFAFILSLILVYMILGVQFESFLQPFVIILAVPLALIGIILALFVTNTSINIMSLMGTVVLIGIVVNDSIVKIDIINRQREEGYNLVEAVKRGGELRFRPILMTSLTTILGLLPLAIGLGKGSELSSPLAVTIIGGLVTSTVLTLIVIPVIYMVLIEFTENK
ncbi:MAG: efflux RND transporter permease subunit [Candidatus Mcinerneyibacterium aminivorans]|uniref:Efflux RND transporter permease subunit n=1 Tax=Candidatus Mcinerneyibacterium aminivorans TaxID=2703815 RepID=A0A5D0MG24_9BACT|nr:MAG: efflux RND transporter permease subunit [Candidatus Mcinerneyibacterium aminivorans]